MPTVNFISYNSTGISSDKCDFINKLCEENDVQFVSLQEHFKNNKVTDKYFRAKFAKFSPYIVPGFRPSGQDKGRPKAGLAQLSKKNLDIKKDRVKSSSFRIQAQILNFLTSKLLWINLYLPTDPQTQVFDESELLEVLQELTNIIRVTEFTDILVNGDLNWDPRRRTGFSNVVKEFIDSEGLVPLWQSHAVDFTHIHTDMKSTAVLDHFLVNERLANLVEECKVLHLGDNMSRHSPILLRLRVGEIPLKKKVISFIPRKPAWYKATQETLQEYKEDLHRRLASRSDPISLACVDPHCQDPAHSSERDNHMLDILCSVVESSHTVIPMGRRRNPGSSAGKAGHISGCVPGWDNEVKPLQEEARFYHSLWLSGGRPNRGDLYTAMRKSRNLYHYAVRRTRRLRDLHRAKKLFEASLVDDMELIKEMRKVKRGCDVVTELPDIVSGVEGEENIVERFRAVYSTLYNSASTAGEVDIIKEKLGTLINGNSMEEVRKITGIKVKEAAELLKPGKGDLSEGFSSDALLNGPDILFDKLAAVFQSWCVHGTVTPTLLACAFLPLLKSSLKDPADTGSYRAIAGSSLVLKLFDKVVLLLWGHLLTTDSLQFGYKVHTSTTQCSWLVTEVASHFLRQKTCPIITLLDCTKAFDTCQFSTLFQRLLDRGMPAIVVRVIVRAYENQYAWVKWGGSRSSTFSIVNGTRQGSILSPALFAVYVDDLLVELRRLGVGCRVAGVFMGAMGFCDDIVLIAPTRDSMQLMLDTCQRFAMRYNLQFSTDLNPEKSKTKCIFVCGRARTKAKPVNLELAGKLLPWVESAVHLGHVLHQDGTMEKDIKAKRAAYINETVEIRESFGFATPAEVLRAVKLYAGSHYGSMLWDLGSDMATQYYNVWTTCVKLAWQVPRATRSYLVDQLLCCDLTSARMDTLARYARFARGLLVSPSMEVAVMAGVAMRDIRTVTGSNLSLETGIDPINGSLSKLKYELGLNTVSAPDLDKWRVDYLGKLLAERGEAFYRADESLVLRLSNLIDSLCVN